MGRHFDYSDWTFDDICNDIRERIEESKKPIPPKVMRHYIDITRRTGPNCYTYPHYLVRQQFRFTDREEAVKYLNCVSWLERKGDNCWVDIAEKETYTDADGNTVPCHYEIRESDYEEYEDGEYHCEYSDDEKQALSDTLYAIEKARAYLRAYDYSCDECCFGHGNYTKEVQEELEKFEKEYTEELPEDYYSDDDD